jgi:sulfotransferase family protein
MIRHLIAGTKRAFGLHRPGRDLDVFPDDVFLVSYPKSGNTWTRFLVANLVYPDRNVDFSNINQLTPDPEAASKRQLARAQRPRIIKSHQFFDPRYPRVIYIVRDPRDVLLSEYHFGIKRRIIPENSLIEKYVPLFLQRAPDYNYGSWGENVGSWFYVRRYNPAFLCVRYEDLLSDGMRELGRIAEFLGLPPDQQRLQSALERSSADRMRELEKSQAHLWSSTRQTRPDKPFVRAAKAGNWRTDLPPACVTALESAWGGLMQDLGYELSGSGPVGAKMDAGESLSAESLGKH